MSTSENNSGSKEPAGSNAQFPELAPLPAKLADQTQNLLHAPHWMGLALHLPLRFEDLATIVAMDAIRPGEKVNLTATVTGHEEVRGHRKQLKIWVEDGDSRLLLRWLHFYPGQADKMPVGSRLKISGQVRQGYGGLEIVHPTVKRLTAAEEAKTTIEPAAKSHSSTLEPVYPSAAGIKQSDWKRWMSRLPKDCFVDTLTAEIIKRYGLASWQEVLETLHGQASAKSLAILNGRTHPVWFRVKVDELLAQQLLLEKFRQNRLNEPAHPLKGRQGKLIKAFLGVLGFELTAAQRRACAEIAQDLEQPYPMQRLLQGDVGSGKTVVAALSCLQAIECGYQAAIVAPTEVLAEQHYHKLSRLMNAIGVTCNRLQGSMKAKDKKLALAQLAEGQTNLVIGTHALFQESVEFKSLALVVVDEQHRFGVAQRLSLISKAQGKFLAHQLMMSATPIPRTLAQTYLSDLAVSNLDEKPPGRQPIITKLLTQAKREQLTAAIDVEIQKGQQVYWVCPLIEESEKMDLQAAEQTLIDLTEALPHRRIALLHGKQDAKTKLETMTGFAKGEIDVLVSTTVIEVGVDVSNASLMVIDQAERFGLAQLHQLRGRVGRGSLQSVCVLLYGGPLSNTAKTRLKAMHESDDGFYLAEIDLELRGPGELLGKRQSGMPMLKYADPLIDKSAVEIARKIALEMRHEPERANRHMLRWLEDTPWWLS